MFSIRNRKTLLWACIILATVFFLLATLVGLTIFETLGHLPNIGRLFPHFYHSISAFRCGNQLKPEEIQALWVCLCPYSKDLLRSDNLLASARASAPAAEREKFTIISAWLAYRSLSTTSYGSLIARNIAKATLSSPTQLTSSFGLMQYPEDYNLSHGHILKYSIGHSPAHWRGTCILSFL